MSYPEPLVLDQPGIMSSLRQRIDELNSLQGTLDPQVINSINALQVDRATRLGRRPYTLEAMAPGLVAAQTEQAVTEPEQRSATDFFGNLRSNIGDIGGALNPFVLVPGLINEAREIPNVGQAFAESFQGVSNPLEGIGNLAGQPVFRMVPGAFVAEQLFGEEGGGVAELARNPVFTALDVAPFAGSAARATSRGRALTEATESAYRTQAAAFNEARLAGDITARAPRPPRRIGTRQVLTRTVDEAGNIVPANAAGQLMDSMAASLRRSTVGQFAQSTFGNPSREAAAVAEQAAELGIRNSELLQQIDEIATKHDIPVERRSAMFEAAELDDWSRLADNEVAAMNELTEFADRITTEAILDDPQLARIELAGSEEVISASRASKIENLRAEIDFATKMNDLISDASTRTFARRASTPDEVSAFLDEMYMEMSRWETKGRKDMVARTYLHHLEGQGWDVDRLRQALNRNAADFYEGRWADITPSTRAFEPQVLDGILDRVRRSRDLGAPRTMFLEAMRDGRYGRAATHLREIAKRSGEDFNPAIAELKALQGVERWRARSAKNFRDARIRQMERNLQRQERAAMPGRFQRLVENRAVDILEERVRKGEISTGSFESVDKFMELAREGVYRHIPEAEWRQIRSEARRSWIDLKNAGMNPRYIHRVRPERLGEIARPNVIPRRNIKLSQMQERSMDFAPYVKDPYIALRGQAIELLRRRASREYVDYIQRTHAKSLDELFTQYEDSARVVQQIHPERSLGEILDEQIRREWAPLSDELFPSGRPGASAAPDVWIPRSLDQTLRRMRATELDGLERLMEKPTQIFRTSVLALAPRWHINNIIGGGLMMFAATGFDPRVFGYLRRARRALNAGDEILPRAQLGLGQGLGSVPSEIAPTQAARQIMQASKAQQASLIYRFKAGRQFRRWLDEARGPERARRGIERSYELNQMVDDMYRATAYLYEYDKALRRGLSESEAVARGIGLTRKTLQEWDRMTPLERSVIRSVFPFYGWMSHVMRFMARFPSDHPWRTAVLSNFARSELEDYGTGLPQRFHHLLFLGGEDAMGGQMGLTLGGASPFDSLADYVTLQGLAGQAHPAIGAVLESLGVDTRTGTADLYPNTYYNPETGRIEAKPATAGNILGNFIGAFAPQTDVLANLTGLSTTWREIHRTNPDAARRIVMSSLGLPTVAQYVNVPQERFKSELERYEAMNDALNEAVRTGDYSTIERFPSAAAYLEQIRALDPEALAPFTRMEDNGQSLAEFAGSILTAGFGSTPEVPDVEGIEEAYQQQLAG